MLKVKLQINKPLPFYLLKSDNIAISDVTGIFFFNNGLISLEKFYLMKLSWIVLMSHTKSKLPKCPIKTWNAKNFIFIKNAIFFQF